MNKSLIIAAASALALGTVACHKSADTGGSSNVSAEDNMLVPADENSMGADANGGVSADNGVAAENATETNTANGAGNGM